VLVLVQSVFDPTAENPGQVALICSSLRTASMRLVPYDQRTAYRLKEKRRTGLLRAAQGTDLFAVS
jgi:hypothetical protein